jgi:hypothetical protein
MATVTSGRPTLSACAIRSSRRTACMATRSAASLIVVSRATTSTSPAARAAASAKALSLPLLQLIQARFTERGSAAATR